MIVSAPQDRVPGFDIVAVGLGAPVVNGGDALIEQLTEARKELNQHVLRLHERSTPSQLTPYEVMRHLVRLMRIGQSTSRFALEGALLWEPHHKNERCGRIQDLVQRVEKMGDLAYYEAVLALMVCGSPELAKFDGVKHSQKVVSFVDLDRRRMRQAIGQVLKAHHECLPKNGGAAGPTGVLRAEMARQRKHMPIRQLMHRCAPAIQALKPVFMMSPLSVAQFLPPGVVQFDVLVIDEASQVQPVDALGAIARAKQLIIVGDERQLPPTRFFSRILGNDRDDDEQGASAADMESILGLCKVRGLPERPLSDCRGGV